MCCAILLRFLLCDASAQELNKIGFGLIQTVNPELSGRPMSSFSSIFLNYRLSSHLKIQLEHKNGHGFFSVFDKTEEAQARGSAGWLNKDWSTKIFLQYYLNPADAPLTSYFGIGAGRYYIYDSKRKIKAARDDTREENLDYAMRKYFRKPGIIGAMGLEYSPFAATTFFLRGQCSLLFDESETLAEPKTHFSDFINISAGLRLKLK